MRVLDGDDNVLANFPNQTISETTRTPFDFSANPLTAPVIRLQFDSGNLGFLSDDIAFDNIRFGQAIPEPASLALVGLGGVLMLGRRRRTPMVGGLTVGA